MIHSQYGGSGLGLFICRSECSGGQPGNCVVLTRAEISELLGGRIEVFSELGKGSSECFAVVGDGNCSHGSFPVLHSD